MSMKIMSKPQDLDLDKISEHSLTETEAETLFAYLLGEDINKEITTLYSGRGVPKLWGFRRSLHESFENGSFVAMNPSTNKYAQRTGNDDNAKHPINRRILALCGYDAFVRIGDMARPVKLSNMAALREGLRSALDRWAL